MGNGQSEEPTLYALSFKTSSTQIGQEDTTCSNSSDQRGYNYGAFPL